MEKEIIKNATLMGYNVFWSVTGTVLPIETIVDEIRREGLDESLLSEPTSKRAVIRAAKSVSKADNGRFEENFVRKIADNDQKYSVGILHESKDAENDEVSATQTTMVKYLKEEGRVVAEGECAEEFKVKFDEYKTGVTDDDIRSFILKTIRQYAYGISLRARGGIYFVPVCNKGVIDKLDAVLKRLGIGEMFQLKVIEGVSENIAIHDALDTDIRKQVEALRESVKMTSERVKPLCNKREKVVEMQEMVKTYQAVLDWETEVEEIMQVLQDADNMLVERIKELS